jgi:ABC-type glycerol-3-phosphate transport system substrate-binding protein
MKERRLSRRDFLHLSVGAAAGTLLVACQPQVIKETVEVPVERTVEVEKEVVVVATPAPIEVAEIRLAEGSWVGPEGIAFWTDDIIPRFEGENPGIKVTWESAESADYEDKLYTQAVAGDAPDVFFIWWSAGLMEEGQLLPLEEYFDEAYMADFYPANIVGQVYEGHMYGVPKYVSTVAMAYNKDLLDEAGVAYPDGTWDWDDYLEAFKATTKPDGSQWGTYVVPEYINHWVWENEGEWMNADLFGTKCLLNEEKALEALKFNHDLAWGPDPVSPKPGTVGEFGWWDIFSSGKVAFVESHSWTVTNYMRQNDFKWDFVDLPIGRTGKKAGLTFVNSYSVYAGTKYPDASVKLVEFLTGQWAMKQMCLGILGLQPVRKSVVPTWDVDSMGARAGYDVAAFSRIMDYARLIPIFKDDKQILQEIFNPVWEQIWVTGEMGLEEGIQLIVDRIDQHFAG